MNIIQTNNKKYILQHVHTSQYVCKKKELFKNAEYTFTNSKSEATEFTNEEATAIIAATAVITSTDIMELLKGIEV